MRVNRNTPAPLTTPPALSAEVLVLRRSWKWAYLSHFLFTFNPILHLEDIQLSELEDDLASGTYTVLPIVMQRLLMSLTPHDKRMILEDWQHQLRRQSLKRASEENLMGTDDDPVNFESLLMMDKLDIFHALCEWQFHNPNSLRSRMRDDDELANWRIEPMAYDAKGNAYWLMGGNRLWMQQTPTRKRPPVKSKKRKQPATSATNGRKSAKRSRTAVSTTSKPVAPPPPRSVNGKTGGTPAASARRPVRETRSRVAGLPASAKSRPLGTRVSSRLRGREEEDLWQEIPEEWLKNDDEGSDYVDSGDEGKKGKNKRKSSSSRTKLLDDISELTSLSDLSDLPEEDEDEAVEEDDYEEQAEEEVEEEADERRSPTPLHDFSTPAEETWETVCTTLQEWEEFPKRFENSTHRGEKAFYKLLVDHLVPMVTEVLKVDIQKQIMEEAVVTRKRSSRLAVKQSVREAEREEARRKAEEEKEMERHRRWEARAKKEEEERQKVESMRSVRIREKAGIVIHDIKPETGDNAKKPPVTNGTVPTPAPVKFVVNTKSGTQTPKEDEGWELDCEVCHRRGRNLDDGQELMSCEKCNKWQHIRCHDQSDFITGRPRRNWELEDFTCKACSGAVGLSSSHEPTNTPKPKPKPKQEVHRNTQNGPSVANNNNTTVKPVAVTKAKVNKQPAAPAIAVYGNGRGYLLPPQGHHPSYPVAHYAALPHQASAASGSGSTAVYTPPGTPQSRTHVPAPSPSGRPYSSAPNMYLSNYSPASGSYRPTQDPAANAAQQPPPVQTCYRPTMIASAEQQNTWSHHPHQPQYGQQTRTIAGGGSVAIPYVATSTAPTIMSNGHYRTLQPAPSPHFPTPLPAPAPAPTQHYNGGSGPQQ